MAERLEFREGSKPVTCPYCRAPLAAGEAVWSCPMCHTGHHDECARSHGRCTVLGCATPFQGAAPRMNAPRNRIAGVPFRTQQPEPSSRGLWIGLTIVFVVLVLLAAMPVVGERVWPEPPPAPAPVDPNHGLPEAFVKTALDELAHRRTRAASSPDGALDLHRDRTNPRLRERFAAEVASGKDPNGVGAALEAALRAHVPSAEPVAIEAVLRTARSNDPAKARREYRRVWDTNGWWGYPTPRYVIETSANGSVTREAKSRDSSRYGSVEFTESWLDARELASEGVLTPAGAFQCRHIVGVVEEGDRMSRIEIWIADRMPVPVKTVRTNRDGTQTSLLVAIEKPR